jgi:hypothetical protein
MSNPLDEVLKGFRSQGLLRGWLWTVRIVVPVVLVVVIYQVGGQAVDLVVSLLFQ